jgi:hypothetical protein
MRIRSLHNALLIGYREAVLLLIGGGMALLFGLIFTAGGSGALIDEYKFLTNSTTGIAEILGKERAGQNNFFVDCRLLLGGAGKVVYQKRLPVYSGLWQNLRKGQSLNVEYLRDDPANMRLPGSIGNLGDSLLHLLAGMFLVMVGTVVVIVAIQVLARGTGMQKAEER